jgi:hypothetical protein
MPPAAMSIGCTWRRTSCSISASLWPRATVSARAAVFELTMVAAASVAPAMSDAVVNAAVIRIASLPSSSAVPHLLAAILLRRRRAPN